MSIRNFHVLTSKLRFSLVLIFLVSFPVFAADLGPSIETCVNAVRQASQYGEATKGVADLRLHENKISPDAHQQLIQQVEDMKSTLTVQNCMTSQGSTYQTYVCLAAGDGNYTACDK